jgi:hypothetical protein
VDRALKKHPDWPLAYDDPKRYVDELREISNYVRETNGLRPGDSERLFWLKFLLGKISVKNCCDLLEDVRDEILSEMYPSPDPSDVE